MVFIPELRNILKTRFYEFIDAKLLEIFLGMKNFYFVSLKVMNLKMKKSEKKTEFEENDFALEYFWLRSPEVTGSQQMITKDHHLDPLMEYRLSRLLVIHRNSIHRQLKKSVLD